MKPTLIYDTEVYEDYFLVSFLNAETGNTRHIEMFPGQDFNATLARKIIGRHRLVSFNGINFDMPLITMALTGATCSEIKAVCNKIIKNNLKPWVLGIESIDCDHIDLIEVSPGMASLKIYGGRLHCAKLQDLPIDPDALIAPEQREILRHYCENDLRTTLALFKKLEPQINLRTQMSDQYGIDLRSKSDAQIAEAVISSEVAKLLGKKIPKPADMDGKTFKYQVPKFIEFRSPALQSVLATVKASDFAVLGSGQVKMPDTLGELKIAIGQSVYQMGIGGLHSTEKCAAHIADDLTMLIDRDVSSYYPSIILNCGLKPANMGDPFTKVYRDIVQRRLAAKASGDTVTDDALKITINGSFGKFGSKYSILYSPTLLIQTTITGQLALLMLIEAIECEGISVVSANTDGVVIKCPKAKAAMLDLVIWEWELQTSLATTEARYKAIYSRDVNNYIAIKNKGYKVKGAYAPAGLQKNPTTEICTAAVIARLTTGRSVESFIRECKDITKFVAIRQVKGGAVDQQGAYLGKAVRWYYSTKVQGAIRYKLNGYTVARSEGARPLMDLPDTFPTDLDYDWYIAEANDILKNIGATHDHVSQTPETAQLELA